MAKSKRGTPRPYVIAGYLVILVTFGMFGGWAYFARIDSAVIASGQVALEDSRQVVQHLEGGIVTAIHAHEADRVEEGDILLELSSIEARSNVGILERRRRLARAVEARLLAERSDADTIDFPADLDESESPAVIAALQDQSAIFEDRRSILLSQTNILESRVSQLGRQIQGLATQRAALEERLGNFEEMVERMRTGVGRGVVQENALVQREDELIQVKANLGQIETEVAQAESQIGETEFQIIQIGQQYRERAGGELKEVRQELSEIEERLKVARDQLNRTSIRAPASGTVQNVSVSTVGSVVGPGEILMEIVPKDDALVVNARVAPLDIDNVAPGLETEVRFTAINSRFTPIVLGQVGTVSSDVITPNNPNDMPYYLARIMVDDIAVPEILTGRLTPGMPVDVVISTGERTVASFLMSPLLDAVRKSLIEE